MEMNTRLLRLTTRTKRIFALLLALALCLPFAACNEEIELVEGKNPEGGYSFSYPETWRILNNGTTTQLTVAEAGGALPYAMVRFTVFENADGISATDYFNSGVGGFSLIYDKYKVLENKRGPFEKGGINSGYSAVIEVSLKGETKLDGQPDGAGKSADYVIHQTVFEGDGRICVATFMSSAFNYDSHSSVMKDIKESFAFTAAEEISAVEDKGVAEFSVPTPAGWTMERAEAYYRFSLGKATVIASVFAMSDNYSAKEYWENSYKASVSGTLVNFKEGEIKDAELGGVKAIDVTYTGSSVSGKAYNFRQVICVYYGQLFMVTLTADDADYEEAVKGFNAIVKGFKFK